MTVSGGTHTVGKYQWGLYTLWIQKINFGWHQQGSKRSLKLINIKLSCEGESFLEANDGIIMGFPGTLWQENLQRQSFIGTQSLGSSEDKDKENDCRTFCWMEESFNWGVVSPDMPCRSLLWHQECWQLSFIHSNSIFNIITHLKNGDRIKDKISYEKIFSLYWGGVFCFVYNHLLGCWHSLCSFTWTVTEEVNVDTPCSTISLNAKVKPVVVNLFVSIF